MPLWHRTAGSASPPANVADDVPNRLRRSGSESDVILSRETSRKLQLETSDSEDDGDANVWVVADVCSPDFGKRFTNMKAIAEVGVTCGDYCMIPRKIGTGNRAGAVSHREEKEVILLKLVPSRARFKDSFYSQAQPQMTALHAMMKIKSPDFGDKRTDERRDELSHWDMVAERPDIKTHRVGVAIVVFALLAAVVYPSYQDRNPSLLTPILVTILYPTLLFTVSRIMLDRPPAGDYVFEFLLVFDVYQLVSSLIMFGGSIYAAAELEMLLPPVGHSAMVSSHRLRILIWWHYSNRICDMFY